MESLTPNYRIHFARHILGALLTIGAVAIAPARDPGRALRAAELRFARHFGVADRRERADRVDLAPVAGNEPI